MVLIVVDQKEILRKIKIRDPSKRMEVVEQSAIPVLNKNTCERWLNIIIFRNNYISLSTFTEYESKGRF